METVLLGQTECHAIRGVLFCWRGETRGRNFPVLCRRMKQTDGLAVDHGCSGSDGGTMMASAMSGACGSC